MRVDVLPLLTHRDGGPCTILHVILRGIAAVEVGEGGLDVNRVGGAVVVVVVAGRGGRISGGGGESRRGGGLGLPGGTYNRREKRGGVGR